MVKSKKIFKAPLKAILPAALALALSLDGGYALAGPITLTGDYIKIGTNDVGTIGSGGNVSPGILYDNTGTGTFNTAYDYLTPGSPFEGFSVKATSGGTTYSVHSNNESSLPVGLTGTLTSTSSGTYQGVSWSGSYTPSGGSKLFDIVNNVGFNTGDKKITITTTLTATQALTDLYFARMTDPDAIAAPGDSSSTNNFRGNGSVPASNLVYAEALVSKYVIGLYSAAGSGVNTGVSSGWSTDPTVYYSGTDDGNGDYVIGVSSYTASLDAGGTVTYTYYYIFGSDIAAAIAASVASSSPTVLGAARSYSNSPTYGAAAVIDSTPDLLALFSGSTTEQQRSDAATQTLPLLTGASMVAASSALSGINRVIQARFEANRGMSSGNAFIGDRNVWAKPFGSWAEQSDRNGVAGFKADTAGLAIGADGAVNDNLRVGAALAYAKANVDGSSSIAPHDANVDVYQLIAYGSYALDERTEVNFQADVGQNQNKGKRTIAFTNTTASSSYDSQTAHVGVGLARSYPLNAKTTVTPSVRADYTWIKDDSYLEKGAGLLNLDVDSRSTEELILSLDGKISHQVDTQTSMSANLGVGYDTLSKRTSVTASFAGAPGVAFTTEGISPSPWLARGGAGLTHMTAGGTEITVRYDAEYRTDFLNQTASLKANWTF